MNLPPGSSGQMSSLAGGLTPRSPGSDTTLVPPGGRSLPRTSRQRWVRLGLIGGGVLVALGCGYGVLTWQRVRSDQTRTEIVRELPLSLVSRVDFQSRLTASGRVESHRKTTINCELERLSISNEGRVVTTGENARVLEVIEEGRRVKAGDVLCRLDSSEYEELVRTQTMKTDQAQAALDQAQLSFDVAELAVQEYQKGLFQQNIQLMEGQIALAESDVERATDRLRWTADMLVKGYVPVAQRALAERTLAQSQLKLMTGRTDLDNFRKYGNPRTLMELQSEVEKRRYEVTANTQRTSRLNERLAHYRKMVDFCTIRSPHDGLVIYAVNPWRRNAPRLEPGVEVYQQQPLFYLPDLAEMEVVTYLHESVARQVNVGLATQVKIEGLGNQSLPGHLIALGPLPVSSPVWTTSDEVKYFVGTVKLDQVPAGLLPGMSAEVEVDLTGSGDVLAVPSEAVASEHGQDVCYVAGTDGLERRPITLGRSTRDLLEVTGGLAEGEEVVVNPAKVDALDSLIVNQDHADRDRLSEPAATGSVDNGPVGVE